MDLTVRGLIITVGLIGLFGLFAYGAVTAYPWLAVGTVAVLAALGIPPWVRSVRMRRRWEAEVRAGSDGG